METFEKILLNIDERNPRLPYLRCTNGHMFLEEACKMMSGAPFNPRLTGGGGCCLTPPPSRIFAIAQKRSALST